MARRVFFSFHHTRDSWRVGQVRNCGLGRDREAVGFWDAAEWEKLKRQGNIAVQRWINENLGNTSVTAVLIGAETSQRPWVRYEIAKSFEKGNGLVGVYIHNVKDTRGQTDNQGSDPFEFLYFRLSNNGVELFEWNGSQWTSYAPIPKISIAALRVVGNNKEGKLSQFITKYDWVKNNGRENLGVWAEDAAKRAGR